MIDRCERAKNDHYKWYGGRGIRICAAWRKSFAEFRDWALRSGYADNLTIDRRDNDGDYEPSNCRWITKSENSSRANEEHRARQAAP
jgi:hypothetical protein